MQQKFDMVRIEVKQESNLKIITFVNKLYIKSSPSLYTTICSNIMEGIGKGSSKCN